MARHVRGAARSRMHVLCCMFVFFHTWSSREVAPAAWYAWLRAREARRCTRVGCVPAFRESRGFLHGNMMDSDALEAGP